MLLICFIFLDLGFVGLNIIRLGGIECGLFDFDILNKGDMMVVFFCFCVGIGFEFVEDCVLIVGIFCVFFWR